MKCLWSRLVVLLVAGTMVVAGLSGCRFGDHSAPARLYVLTPLAEAAPGFRPSGGRDVSIGVGPVEVPQYVNRPEIVTGRDTPELQSAAAAEWAEPVRDGLTRVLAENLSRLLGTERVALFPWRGLLPEYQVVVDVLHFLGQPGGEVTLVALWSVIDTQHQKELVSKKSRFLEPGGGADYEALVAAMSRAVAALSRDIATALSALPAPPPARP